LIIAYGIVDCSEPNQDLDRTTMGWQQSSWKVLRFSAELKEEKTLTSHPGMYLILSPALPHPNLLLSQVITLLLLALMTTVCHLAFMTTVCRLAFMTTVCRHHSPWGRQCSDASQSSDGSVFSDSTAVGDPVRHQGDSEFITAYYKQLV